MENTEEEKERISKLNIKAYHEILNSNGLPNYLERSIHSYFTYPAKGKENWIAPKLYKRKSNVN